LLFAVTGQKKCTVSLLYRDIVDPSSNFMGTHTTAGVAKGPKRHAVKFKRFRKFPAMRKNRQNTLLISQDYPFNIAQIVEDFTEKVKRDRQLLANYAREQARQTRYNN
jgi:heme exporter protein D